ncbi:MAG: PD-(D/E)XK nuclease family protein [Halioglobus sp.]
MTSSFYNIEPLTPYLIAGDFVFTPNFRLARQVKAEWDRSKIVSQQHNWPSASVSPLEQWLLEQWRAARAIGKVERLALLDDHSAREIWLQVIAQDQNQHSDYSLLQGGAASEQAMLAYSQLYRWQVPVGSAGVSAQFSQDQDCATYLRWHLAFEKRVSELGMIHPMAALSQLRDSVETPVIERAALLDFDELPSLFLACISKLSGSVERLDSGRDHALIGVAPCVDRKAELAAAAHWAAHAYRDNPEQTVGIVLTDMDNDRGSFEIHLRRAFDCLGDNYNALPVNFSTGISLDHAPVVRDALLMLGATAPSINLPDVVNILQSRFNRCLDGRSDLAIRLISDLYSDGQAKISTAILRRRAKEVALGERKGLTLGSVLYDLMAMRLERKKQLPSAWVESWMSVLDAWGWPGAGNLDSLEYQQVERWYATLEEFAGLDAVLGTLGLVPALAALQRTTRARVSQPQTADSNVQVLGTLEAAGLHFDKLWVTGLQASRWPPAPRPSPFVPFHIQHDAGFPHASAESEWQYRHALVMRFRRSAQEVVCSYREQVDAAIDHPSPLIANLPIIEPKPGGTSVEQWILQRDEYSVEEIVDEQAPALLPKRLEGIRGGSGIVEDQSNCGFRAFARRRLHLEPLGEYRHALSSAERGSLMHAALQALWGRLETSAALATIDDNRETGLAAHVALDGLRSGIRERVGMACLELEQQRLQSLLCEWLATERARPPFTVVAREELLQTNLQGLPLTMRMDRRDALEEGGELVIDYKSSANSLGQWFGDRPAKPQLPLYLIASQYQSSSIAFAEVKAGKCRWLGLGSAEGIPGVSHDVPKATKRYASFDNWDALLAHWNNTLQGLVTAFIRGDAAVDPLPKACDFCGLKPVCRIGLAEGVDNVEQSALALSDSLS